MKTYWQHCRKDLVMNCGPYGVCDKNGKDFIMPKNHFWQCTSRGFQKSAILFSERYRPAFYCTCFETKEKRNWAKKHGIEAARIHRRQSNLQNFTPE